MRKALSVLLIALLLVLSVPALADEVDGTKAANELLNAWGGTYPDDVGGVFYDSTPARAGAACC